MKIGEQISVLRKKRGLTQEELAQILGVTNQAVSKLESNKCCPDIELLPTIADVFQCSMDMLFGRENAPMDDCNSYKLCTELPWTDDDVIRGVVYKGRNILTMQSGIIDKFTFEFKGEAKSLKTHCNLSVTGSVYGGCHAGHSISVNGSVMGGCNAGHSISVDNTINGGINCGHSVNCAGNISGKINCETITADGDVTAEKIDGNVICKTLKCDNVDGKIAIQSD